MQKLTLYTNRGEKVIDVIVPAWQTPVEIYIWGERFFVRRSDGRYTEAGGSFWIPPTQAIEPNVVDDIGSISTTSDGLSEAAGSNG